MIQIREYLTTKIIKASKIHATNKTLRRIVREEIDKYGYDADLNHIDVSEITGMFGLFGIHNDKMYGIYDKINPDISEWDVSNVETMECMFTGCTKFNCDISKWDVSNVETMNEMFSDCSCFDQDISKWDVRKVNKEGCYYSMFENCPIKEEYKPHFKI